MTEKIPAEEAEFFFDVKSGKMPADFVVARQSLRLAEIERTGVDSTERFPQSLGAHVAGWLGDSAHTPAGVFARLFFAGLGKEPSDRALNALHEIARIEGQDWAETMAEAIETYWRLRRD